LSAQAARARRSARPAADRTRLQNAMVVPLCCSGCASLAHSVVDRPRRRQTQSMTQGRYHEFGRFISPAPPTSA
jgi:hypothetical protein